MPNIIFNLKYGTSQVKTCIRNTNIFISVIMQNHKAVDFVRILKREKSRQNYPARLECKALNQHTDN